MKSIKYSIFMLGIFIMGCTSTSSKTDLINDVYSEELGQIKCMIYYIFEIVKSKDMDSLDSYHLTRNRH